MFSINEYPFLRISICLILGILTGFHFNISNTTILLIVLTLISCLYITKNKITNGICLSSLIFVFGIFAYNNYNLSTQANCISNFIGNEITIKGNATADIKHKNKQLKFNIDNIILLNNNEETKLSGKLQIIANNLDLLILPGDEIYINTVPKEILEPLFKNTFNYKQYLYRENIFAFCQIKNEKNIIVKSGKLSLYKFSYQLKQKIISLFNIYLNEESSALAVALITGEDDFVDSKIIEAFKNTGTMHLLAVSGMHVGLIFLILNFLFKPLKRNNFLESLINVFILLTIWLFCGIAGLSDSVVRAGIMISFTIIGHLLNKKNNNLNLIFAGVFVMLIYKPTYIFNPGFQLSLSAVFGILFYYKPITTIISSKYKLGNYIWDFSALSIAAQIGTLPVSLFYFNQFPVWFLISNLLLIPLSTILIYLCILLIALSPIKILSLYVAKILCYGVECFSKIILFLNKMPLLLIDNISFPTEQSLLLISAIITGYWILKFKKYTLIKYNLTLIILFLLFGIYKKTETLKRSQTYVIKNNYSPYIINLNGNNCAIIYKQSNKYLENSITSYLKKEGISEIEYIDANQTKINNFFYLKNKTLISDKGIFSIKIKRKYLKKNNQLIIDATHYAQSDTLNSMLIKF